MVVRWPIIDADVVCAGVNLASCWHDEITVITVATVDPAAPRTRQVDDTRSQVDRSGASEQIIPESFMPPPVRVVKKPDYRSLADGA